MARKRYAVVDDPLWFGKGEGPEAIVTEQVDGEVATDYCGCWKREAARRIAKLLNESER